MPAGCSAPKVSPVSNLEYIHETLKEISVNSPGVIPQV